MYLTLADSFRVHPFQGSPLPHHIGREGEGLWRGGAYPSASCDSLQVRTEEEKRGGVKYQTGRTCHKGHPRYRPHLIPSTRMVRKPESLSKACCICGTRSC